MLPHTIQVNVTREDIRNGKRRSYGECPVALAVTRTLEELGETHWRVTVRPSGTIRLSGMLADVTYQSSGMAVYRFIQELDVNGKRAVKPMQFEATKLWW